MQVPERLLRPFEPHGIPMCHPTVVAGTAGYTDAFKRIMRNAVKNHNNYIIGDGSGLCDKLGRLAETMGGSEPWVD